YCTIDEDKVPLERKIITMHVSSQSSVLLEDELKITSTCSPFQKKLSLVNIPPLIRIKPTN
ncbi:hypothetical protein HHI36_004526, partial [Cryptolaemus montrouzieri]